MCGIVRKRVAQGANLSMAIASISAMPQLIKTLCLSRLALVEAGFKVSFSVAPPSLRSAIQYGESEDCRCNSHG